MKKGAERATLPLLTDGEWHPLPEVMRVLDPFTNGGDPQLGTSELVSQMRCERMGFRGRQDQQVRWRPDLYLEEKGEAKINFTLGADAVLRGLLGLRSFQQLIVQPGQTLNPTQRYWLDRALTLTTAKISELDEADDLVTS